MAKKYIIKSASSDEQVYIDSIDIVNSLLKELNIYSSSQKRVILSDYLFGIVIDNEQVGFVSGLKGEIEKDVISLDFCMLKKYRKNNLFNKVYPMIVRMIEKDPNYGNEYIVIDKNKCHDDYVKGYNIDNNRILLQNKLKEYNSTHEKIHTVTRSHQAFTRSGIKRREQ